MKTLITGSLKKSGDLITSENDVYKSNFEHLFMEFQRIDMLIQSYIRKLKAELQDGSCDYQGLFITEKEIDHILQNSLFESEINSPSGLELEEIETLTHKINIKKIECIKNGQALRLPLLSDIFHLNSFEIDVLLICLVSELKLPYEQIYSYLQNDITKKRPTVDLVIKLLCQNVEERIKARINFSPSSPLLENHLIYLSNNGNDDHSTLLSRSIKVDERIISFLLEFDEIDPRIKNFSTIINSQRTIKDLILPENAIALIDKIKWYFQTNNHQIFFLAGPYGTGKKTVAEMVSNEFDMPLLIVDSKALLEDGSYEMLDLVLREALLHKASIYFEGFDAVVKDTSSKVSPLSVIKKMDQFPNWIFLSGEQSWEPPCVFNNHGFISLKLPLPDANERKMLWEAFLDGYDLSGDVNLGEISSKFKLSGGQIKDAIFTADQIAKFRSDDNFAISLTDLYRGCKIQSNQNLSSMAKKIDPRYTWEEIILPTDVKEQLKEISSHVTYRGTVYSDWGFNRKLSLGKGLNIFFSGTSGTGKTMAAEIIAREVGLDIYKIDLSSMVSKYIGETEKNLQKIFREAETSNAILFFDEADALFGKRTETRDSHDRYANIEVNYLLQKMEEHEGIVILATNFKNNIDDAFLRRIHFAIEFPPPDEKSREQIWKNIFPLDTPIEGDIDFVFLSKFKITGGNIKNIALSAAFLAASNSSIVKIEHLIKATKREFQKMGKLCTSGDFGKYYELVK
ncbi:MAG TPA: ATP-binding protein [Candidatus Nanoarchaeia archaeon]|nr:ATP-binding protein [Candidatus Nanoarchaeia archaeon]